MGNPPVKIIQISDSHLMDDPEDELLGVCTQKSLEAVIQLIEQNKEPMDMILLTGDVAQDGSDVAYKRIAEMLAPFNVPVYWVPGNHDDSRVMSHTFPLENISNHKHILLKDWHLILLNSQIPEQVPGKLAASQLNFMKHCLQTYPEHHAIIVFHHHPIPLDSKWLDNIGLQNAEEFWNSVANFPKVHSIFFGHVHQESDKIHGQIHCYSSPSTCIQFKRHQEKFHLDNINPGYRWIHLYEDGKLETGIRRTEKYIGKFMKDAKGY